MPDKKHIEIVTANLTYEDLRSEISKSCNRIAKDISKLSLANLHKARDVVKSLSNTNCGWITFALKDGLAEIIQSQIDTHNQFLNQAHVLGYQVEPVKNETTPTETEPQSQG